MKMDLDFRIELQYSDDLDPPTNEIRRAQEKLEYLLSTVKHPLALKQFLGLIANAPTHNSATRWYVWKGKTGRGKGQFHSSLRFVLQSSRVSNELIVLTVRFRDTHDKYEQYLKRIQNQDVVIQSPEYLHPKKFDQQPTNLLTWIKLPIVTDTTFVHQITECAGIQKSLDRYAVLDAIKSRTTTTIDADGQVVTVTTVGNETLLGIDGLDFKARRAYDLSCLDSDERWQAVRESSDQPEIDPCLILSQQEKKFLADFTREESLPARVDGSAGSGKTTLLSIMLAKLIATQKNVLSDLYDAPLFLTYSAPLCEVARKRLKTYLIVHHDWLENEADRISKQVCRTFTEIVDEILGEFETNQKSAGRTTEWDEFLTWWNNGSNENSYIRGGQNPADVYRAFRICVFGYLPVSSGATDEQIQEVYDRILNRHPNSDFTKVEIDRFLRIWEEYRRVLTRGETSADRTLRATQKIVDNPNQFATWGHILCDEVQDLTDHDVRLLTCLTRYSLAGKQTENSQSGVQSFNVTLPLILAGDEMQSINPSGFTFVGCRETLQEIANDLGFEINSLPNPCLLTENFRSLKNIVEVGSAIRQLHNSFDKNRLAPAIQVHRTGPEFGRLDKVECLGELDASIKELFVSRRFSVLLPCRQEEKAQYCGANGALSKIIGATEIDADKLLTPEECKGLEFPTIVLCGFGSAYEEAKSNNRPRWILNALSVAATRARERIIFIDAKGRSEELWVDLNRIGKLELVPELIEKIEISKDTEAETLIERMKGALCDYNSKSVSFQTELSEIDGLKSEIDALNRAVGLSPIYVPSLNLASRAASAWIEYVRGHTIGDWEALYKYSGGRVWERIIDDAIDRSDTTVLNQAINADIHIRSEHLERLFASICMCMLESSERNGTFSALLEMSEKLADLDKPQGRMSYFFSHISESGLSKKHWDNVQSLVLRTSEAVDRKQANDTIVYFESFDLSIPMMAAIEIRSFLDDVEQARSQLKKWKNQIPNELHSTLTIEILLHGYAISWLDRQVVMQDILPVFSSDSFNETSLFNSLMSERSRNSAERNLGNVLKAVNSERTNHLAKAAIRSIVLHEAKQLLNTLEDTWLNIQANYNIERKTA
jgi:superfamily I DNA/RNA helicase